MNRRCCCIRPCVIIEDDYNRVDNTVLGVKWDEVTGDSEILNDQLRMPARAIVIATKPHPVNSPSGMSSMTCKNPQPGNLFQTVINYNYGDGSYYYAELACLADGVAKLRVGSSSAGTLNEVEVSYIAGTEEPLTVCRSLEGIYGTGQASTVAWHCVADNGGRYAGAANASSSIVQDIDDWAFHETRLTNPDNACPICDCDCEGHCLPKILNLTIETEDCAADEEEPFLDGLEVVLVFDPTALPEFEWAGETEGPHWDGSGTRVYGFRLLCTSTQDCVTQWKLIFEGTFSCAGEVSFLCPAQITCHPLELIYGSIICSGSGPPEPPPSCTMSFIITE